MRTGEKSQKQVNSIDIAKVSKKISIITSNLYADIWFMKVLILAGKDRNVNKIELLCTKNDVEPSVYGEYNKIKKGLTSSLEQNDLILIVWDKNSRNNYEVIFSIGYCIGHGKPFVIFTKISGQDTPSCNGNAIVISDNNELRNYILEEKERNNAQCSVNEAKEKILNMGLELTVRDLVEAVSEGENIALGEFLKAGFSVDSYNKNSVSLLNIAIRSGHINIADMLINKGADINTISGDRGNTPLMDAAAEADIEILNKIIDAGAVLNIKSKSGQTALILAIGRHAEDAAIALISAGADINIKDDLGMTAKKYAELFKMERVLELINKGIE